MIVLNKEGVWVYVEYEHPAEYSKLLNTLTIIPEDPEELEDQELYYLYYNEEMQAFPAGLLRYVERKLDTEYTLNCKDKKTKRISVKQVKESCDQIDFWDHQVKAIIAIFKNKYGIINIPTGGGKTEVYAGFVNLLNKKTIAVSGQKNHAYQMYRRFKSLGIDDVAILDGDNPEAKAKHICAVADFVYSRIKKRDRHVLGILSDVDVLSYDEVQHLGCLTWQTIAKYSLNTTYRIGLSATPYDNTENPYASKRDTDLIAATGPIIYKVSVDELVEKNILMPATVNIIPTSAKVIPYYIKSWHQVKDLGIIYQPKRCRLLRNLVYNILKDDPKRRILVLVEWHDQGYILLEDLNKVGLCGKYVHGEGLSTTYKDGKLVSFEEDNKLANKELEDEGIPFLIGSRIYEEAEDIPCITDLIVASGGRKERKTIQRVGRSIRVSKTNDKPIHIWDFYDSHHWMIKAQSNARISTYKNISKYIEVSNYSGSFLSDPR